MRMRIFGVGRVAAWGATAVLVAVGSPLAAQSTLRIVGPTGVVTSYDVAALRRLPSDTIRATPHHGDPIVFRGVRLAELLRRSGIPIDSLRGPRLAWTVIAKAADGYRVAFSMAELAPGLGVTDAWLAYEEAGGPLPANVGPFRLVVPTDGKPSRWARQVQTITVSQFNAPPGSDR